MDSILAGMRARGTRTRGITSAPSVGTCVAPGPPDLGRKDLTGPVQVTGEDVHTLDRDGEGWACRERSMKRRCGRGTATQGASAAPIPKERGP